MNRLENRVGIAFVSECKDSRKIFCELVGQLEGSRFIGVFEQFETALTEFSRWKREREYALRGHLTMIRSDTPVAMSKSCRLVVLSFDNAGEGMSAADVVLFSRTVNELSKQHLQKIINEFILLCELMPGNSKMLLQPFNSYDLPLLPEAYPKRLIVANTGAITIVQLADVLYLESSGSYTRFKLIDNANLTSSKNLKTYEEMIGNHPDFIRVHRSFIVNKKYVTKIQRKRHLVWLTMTDGCTVAIAYEKKEEILRGIMY